MAKPSFVSGPVVQVPLAEGVVDLEFCEVGGAAALRPFWHHYLRLGCGKPEMGEAVRRDSMFSVQRKARRNGLNKQAE